ncbi:MAG: YchJ family protein [Gammaproteobacteria bacterium]
MNPAAENQQKPGNCRCGSGLPYPECCGPLHDGSVHALTAEQLLRSRFSAYALRNANYLMGTWDPVSRPAQIDFSEEDNPVEWVCLEILRCKKGAATDRKGIIEFKAYSLVDGNERMMHEVSQFRKIENRWFYCEGEIRSHEKPGSKIAVGRNAACPCGSGKKAKRCCGAA